MTGVGRVLDLLLPTEPNTAATKGSVTALWLGPDEWLLTCPVEDAAFFINSLREALNDTRCAITEVSDGRVAFALAGPSARDVLAKGCPLDLHPRSFTVRQLRPEPAREGRGADPSGRRRCRCRAGLRGLRRPLLRAVSLGLARGRRARVRRPGRRFLTPARFPGGLAVGRSAAARRSSKRSETAARAARAPGPPDTRAPRPNAAPCCGGVVRPPAVLLCMLAMTI